jgi:clusterin-associated protein 1
VIAKPFELKSMEDAVADAMNQLQSQLTTMAATIENLGSDETNLTAKIDKKKQELDRAEKRLKSLQGVRYIFFGYILRYCNFE